MIMIVHMKEGGITKGLMLKWIIRLYLHKESFKLGRGQDCHVPPPLPLALGIHFISSLLIIFQVIKILILHLSGQNLLLLWRKLIPFFLGL